jgi:hypothetical protein
MTARPSANSYGWKGINMQMKPSRGEMKRMDSRPNTRLFPAFTAITSSDVSVVRPKMKKMIAMFVVVTIFQPFACRQRKPTDVDSHNFWRIGRHSHMEPAGATAAGPQLMVSMCGCTASLGQRLQ